MSSSPPIGAHTLRAVGALALSLTLLASGALAETRRIAIVVGNNAGSGDLPPLRFAENDAGKMARVLVELGDVTAEDVQLLQGRGVGDLERAIARARERVSAFKQSPDVRSVVLFYFSGHSDGEAIELGREKLAYARLKALLAGTGADVRLSIVDACRSGAGLREKGGKPADPFTIRLADALQATGEAFITSSAADEAALESSEVMGSYFTHNLISGLRGAADSSGDKLVTLAEAYRYAYDRTVSATAMLPVGAQHPNYDYRLSGQGELVLATLLKPSAALVLPQAERALVVDLARDQVLVEVPAGPAREVALAPGDYGVRVFKDGQAFGGRVRLTPGMSHTVNLDDLTPVSSSVLVAAKGGPVVVQTVDQPVSPKRLGLGVAVGGTGRILVEPSAARAPKWQLRIGFEPLTTRFGAAGAVTFSGALHLLGLGEMSFEGAPPGQEATNEAGAQLRVGYRASATWWRLELGLGVEGGVGFLSQLYGSRASSLALAAAPRLFLRGKLTDSVSLTVDGDLSITGVTIADEFGTRLQWYAFPSLALGVAFFF
ncbi:MAG: caspase family protein [Myxococcales bacterium]|nr:caspase family protein [Myxococcales bacterium]